MVDLLMQLVACWIHNVIVLLDTQCDSINCNPLSQPCTLPFLEIPNALPEGFPQVLEIMENLENHIKKVPCMEKSWNLKIEKSWNFVK